MKKKLLLTIASLLILTGSIAQINKGTWLVGASSNALFGSNNYNNGSTSRIDINAKVGYFVIENLVVGGDIAYSKYGNSSTTSIGAFGRYYIIGKIFLGMGLKTNYENNDGNANDYSYTSIPFEAGYAAFLSDKVAIEPGIRYEVRAGDVDGSFFGAVVGFTLYFGR